MTTVPLAEIAIINPRGESIANDEAISFVGMAQLNAETATAVPLEVRKYGEVSKGYTVFRDRDVLAAKITPCWENGKVGQARLDHRIGVGSTEFHVIRPGLQLEDRYLLHFLRHPAVRAAGTARMTGSAGQKRVPVAFLQDLAIPLASRGEQRRIAAILDQVDALRTKRRQVLAHVDSLTQSIFHDMFTRQGGESVSLADVAAVTSGITKGRRTSEPTALVPYLAVVNVQAGHLSLNSVKTIEATSTEIERYSLRANDLVLTEGGDPDKLGRGTLWRGELPVCLHQNHVFRVRVNESAGVRSEYLASFMSSRAARSYFRRAAKQTTGIASINMTQLKALPVRIPDLVSQDRFIDRLGEVAVQRASLSVGLAAANELFASLQARAFRGEL